MGLVLLIIILALVFGGIGFVLEAAWWAFVIAVVLLLVGIVTGARGRGRKSV